MFTTERNHFTIYLNDLFVISLVIVFSWSDCLTADIFFSDTIVFPDLRNILVIKMLLPKLRKLNKRC